MERFSDLAARGVMVFEADNTTEGLPDYSRRDFYKICLHSGQSTIHYADKSISIKGYSLFFATPHIPYGWSVESAQHRSYTCLFTETFLNNQERSRRRLITTGHPGENILLPAINCGL